MWPSSVKPKRLPFFKVGKELKERVNEGARLTGPRRREAPDAPEPIRDSDGTPIAAPVTTTGPVPADADESAESGQPGTINRATA